MISRALLLALATFLSACAPAYRLIGPEPRAVASLYSVDPQIRWSALDLGGYEVWTVDGPALEGIRIVKGLAPGEKLFEDEKSDAMPSYRKAMSESEIAEFIADSLSASGMLLIKTVSLQPFDFGGRQGFRYDFTFIAGNSVEMQGIAVGAQIAGRLHLIFYYGARRYYFEKYRQPVERMLASIRIPPLRAR